MNLVNLEHLKLLRYGCRAPQGNLSSSTSLGRSESLCRILLAILGGADIRDAIEEHALQWGSAKQFDTWSRCEDRTVIDETVTRACYLPESLSYSHLFISMRLNFLLAFSQMPIAEDNCHRGSCGAILAAKHGVTHIGFRGFKIRRFVDHWNYVQRTSRTIMSHCVFGGLALTKRSWVFRSKLCRQLDFAQRLFPNRRHHRLLVGVQCLLLAPLADLLHFR